MNPKIIHHGAKHGVTGSCHQLFIDGERSVLIDCGLFQGAETAPDGSAGANQLDIPFAVKDVGALVLTHVHIDHCGRLPWLLAAGFKGPIFCSEPSARLLPTVLADAFQISVTRDRMLVERYLQMVEARLRPLPYRHWHTLYRNADATCRVRLQRAGHILGSVYVEFELSGKAWPQRRRVLFSGDLGAPHAPLLPAPRPPWHADIVVLESTYGDRVHQDRRHRRERLREVIEQALEDGGSVIIPAFSIGRTQELLYELEDILHRQRRKPGRNAARWEALKIYLDSPLAGRFTELYRELQPFWDDEAKARVRAGREPLNYEQLVAIDGHDAHLANVRRLALSAEPAIVIAASGMCAGGRVVNYLKAMLGDARHNVLFVGYQARGTPGNAIQTFGPRGGYVEFDSERITIRAGIHTLSGYSAHADRDDLTRFVTRMRHLPGEVRLVHGEDEVRAAFAAHLTRATAGKVRVLA